MREKKQREETGGADWMDTYGDLVTLLLCFFVMLFASSNLEDDKWVEIVNSFRGYPSGSIIVAIDPEAPTQSFSEDDLLVPLDEDVDDQEKEELRQELQRLLEESKSDEQREIDEEFESLFQQITRYVEEGGLESDLVLGKEGREIYLTIVEGILFDTGRATIRDEKAEQILNEIGYLVSLYIDNIDTITVEGHTDNVPIKPNNLEYVDNFELSTDRAIRVMWFMSEHSGISMAKFRASGRSEYEPIASNDTEDGREKNRRVEIILLAKDVDQLVEGALEYGADVDAGDEGAGVVLSSENSRIVEPQE